jgi:hypothetical protein
MRTLATSAIENDFGPLISSVAQLPVQDIPNNASSIQTKMPQNGPKNFLFTSVIMTFQDFIESLPLRAVSIF